MIVVSDTSPLCNLAIVEHLWLLRELYTTVVIPSVVANELADASELSIQDILNLEWVQVRQLTNISLAESLQRNQGLDPGEANAIALAIELKADDLLIDERLGRREALQLGLPIIGILGILVVAKQRGLIQLVQPVLNALITQAGFRVSSHLYSQILRLAGEA